MSTPGKCTRAAVFAAGKVSSSPRKRGITFAAAAALGIVSAAPAFAATYSVSPSGSDSNNGVTGPFRTLQKAASVLADGDTIEVQPGTYVAGVYIRRKHVTIRGIGTVVLDGTSASRIDGLSLYQAHGVTVENLKIRNCKRDAVFCVLTNGATFRNLELSNNAMIGLLTGNTNDALVDHVVSYGNFSHGVYLSQSGDRPTVRGCTLYNNGKAGLQINAVQGAPTSDPGSDSRSFNCLVEGNTFYGNNSVGGAAIQLMGVCESVIRNNLICRNKTGGITLYDDGAGADYACKNNRIVNNTIVFDKGVGVYGVQLIPGSTGNQLFNNIIAVGKGPAIDTAEPLQSNFNCFFSASTTADGNLANWRRKTGNDANSFEGDPVLTSDFRPAAGSPVIDAGLAMLDTDKDGVSRPQGANPDLGCYEVSSGAPPPVNNGGGGSGTKPSPDPAPAPSPAEALIYGDSLQNGWAAKSYRSTGSLSNTSPIVEGRYSISLTVTGADGYLLLSGSGLSTTGKSCLKFSIHGGAAGGQLLRVRAIVNGVQQGSLNLLHYAKPVKNGWVHYAIPLADLKAANGTLNGVKFFAGSRQRTAYIDDIRLGTDASAPAGN